MSKRYCFEAVLEAVPERGGAYVRFPYDLRQEFGIMLELLEQQPLPPSLHAVCRNIRKVQASRKRNRPQFH